MPVMPPWMLLCHAAFDCYFRLRHALAAADDMLFAMALIAAAFHLFIDAAFLYADASML